MSTENQRAKTNSGMAKGFVLGLVLGIVIGGFAGAFLPTLMEGYRLPIRAKEVKSPPPKVTTHEEEREPAKAVPDGTKPGAEPAPTDGTKPEEKPSDKPNG